MERENELLTALRALKAAVHEYRLLDVKKRFRLSTADAQAGTAIANAEARAAVKAAPVPKTTLFVVIQGGLLQAVASPDPNRFADVEVVKVDYDTDGAEPDDIDTVIDDDGDEIEAFVGTFPVEEATIRLPDEEDEEDGCPKNDPECLGRNEDSHEACEWPDEP